MSKIYCNTTTCPFCGEECGSHTRLIAHMIKCAAGRMPGGNGHNAIVAAIAAAALAVSLMLPAKAQDVQPQPTPAVGGGPSKAVEHKVFLPMIVAPEDGPEGQGRYWGGSVDQPEVSWRPSGS